MLPINNRSANEYFDIFDQVVTQAVSGLETLEQDPLMDEIKTKIVGGLVRRGLSLGSSICILWKAQNFRDCQALYRMLVERFLYLGYLAKTNEFEKFAKFSQAAQYRRIDEILGRPSARKKLTPECVKIIKQNQGERRERFGGKPPEQPSHYWKRPSTKDMAKRIAGRGEELYWQMYSLRSTDVHPTYDDDEIYEAQGGLEVIHEAISLLACLAMTALQLSPRAHGHCAVLQQLLINIQRVRVHDQSADNAEVDPNPEH